jgi:hypothetical protein
VLIINTAHESSCGGEHGIDEDENSLLWRELDALANHINELSNSQICGDQIFFLIDGRDIRLFDFFADDLADAW